MKKPPNESFSPGLAKVVILLISALVLVQICYAAEQSDSMGPDRPHGAMELFGIGPELMENRGLAWVHCIAKIVKEAVIEIGAIVLLIYLTKQNIDQRKQITDVKNRLDNQGQRIHDVAIAAGAPAPPGNNTQPQPMQPIL